MGGHARIVAIAKAFARTQLAVRDLRVAVAEHSRRLTRLERAMAEFADAVQAELAERRREGSGRPASPP